MGLSLRLDSNLFHSTKVGMKINVRNKTGRPWGNAGTLHMGVKEGVCRNCQCQIKDTGKRYWASKTKRNESLRKYCSDKCYRAHLKHIRATASQRVAEFKAKQEKQANDG